MKKTNSTNGKTLRRIAALLVTTIIGLFGCAGGEEKTVASVESMTITQRGMRGGHVYEITETDGITELRLYREVYSGGENSLALEKSVVCDPAALIEMMNTCGVLRWDGFHGKHPKNVSDGIMFTFTASVNGGQVINADGSANFPKGYRDFMNYLDGLLAQSENN